MSGSSNIVVIVVIVLVVGLSPICGTGQNSTARYTDRPGTFETNSVLLCSAAVSCVQLLSATIDGTS